MRLDNESLFEKWPIANEMLKLRMENKSSEEHGVKEYTRKAIESLLDSYNLYVKGRNFGVIAWKFKTESPVSEVTIKPINRDSRILGIRTKDEKSPGADLLFFTEKIVYFKLGNIKYILNYSLKNALDTGKEYLTKTFRRNEKYCDLFPETKIVFATPKKIKLSGDTISISLECCL